MPRYTHKDLIIFFSGKNPKKRGTTGSARDIPVQRGDPVRAALVHMEFFKLELFPLSFLRT